MEGGESKTSTDPSSRSNVTYVGSDEVDYSTDLYSSRGWWGMGFEVETRKRSGDPRPAVVTLDYTSVDHVPQLPSYHRPLPSVLRHRDNDTRNDSVVREGGCAVYGAYFHRYSSTRREEGTPGPCVRRALM